MLLADYAEAINGKLYIMGGGWSITGPEPPNFGIAIKIEVPWDQTNRRHDILLRLLDADGQSVTVPGPMGEQPVEVRGEFEVGRPPGLPHGTPIDSVLAINVQSLPVPPGGRYVWKLWIGDETSEQWELGFNTRPAPPSGQAPPPGPA
jgi:hypothetical protein